MTNINQNNYSEAYLNTIENVVFQRMDSIRNGGNGDGKVSVNEAYNDLNISGMLSGQNEEDTAKIKNAAKNIQQVLAQYAGEDGVFNSREWAEFLNGKEWQGVLDAWHSSEQITQYKIITTKDKLRNRLLIGLQSLDAFKVYHNIEKLLDQYAGEDGAFTIKEYQDLKADPEYKEFIKRYHSMPFDNKEPQKDLYA